MNGTRRPRWRLPAATSTTEIVILILLLVWAFGALVARLGGG